MHMDTNKQILQSIQEIKKRLGQMATKDDLKRFATKDDLFLLEKRFDQKFATKDDLKQFATKDDLKKFATKDDLKQFATKIDLQSMKNEIIEEISDLITDFVQTIDEHKADRKDVAHLEKRVDKLEAHAS